MGVKEVKTAIQSGNTVLGIELGSTRIKAVLVGEDNVPIASGSHDWENRLENGIWTYQLEDIWTGLQDCYARLAADVKDRYGEELVKIGALGFSAMMHGYMAFDQEGNLLAPFRTWRNTITGQASQALSELFQFHIPQRWSIAHLYQAILNGEEHVPQISFFTTLAGYITWKLTGSKTLGVGDASGMFPIDSGTCQFDAKMIAQFDEQIRDKGYPWKLEDILPSVAKAGVVVGTLTEEGARQLDVSGKLEAGVPVAPPEGDAGTGMAATNSVNKRTGNVSAGTSVFSMVVLEKPLSRPYDALDLVTTPDGAAVAMVHCNNCTSDLNAWVNLFRQFSEALGISVDMNTLFGTLYNKALEGDADCGGLLAYNYFSGEPITGFEEGRPLFVRTPNARFTLENFMRVHLFTALGAIKVGNDILAKENVKIDRITGHGGLFKTPVVGQKILAAALNAPVSVMETAGEGGAWGMALLASYMRNKAEGESLGDFLESRVFNGNTGSTIAPDPADVAGFDAFIANGYLAGLSIERAAIDSLK